MPEDHVLTEHGMDDAGDGRQHGSNEIKGLHLTSSLKWVWRIEKVQAASSTPGHGPK